jgi:HAE1 family hydrophobic/amphiphilic exporter-1
MMGIIFQELALTVAFSLIASLLIALTLVPMLSSKWLSQLSPHPTGQGLRYRLATLWERSLAAIEDSYRWLLGLVMRYRALVMLGCLAVLGLSLPLYNQLGSELLPSVDEGMMYIRVEMPVGTRLDATDRVVADIERTVHATAPEVQAMFARIGLSWQGGGGTHTGFVWVRLKDLSQRQQSLAEVIGVLQRKLSNYPGANVRIVERPSDVPACSAPAAQSASRSTSSALTYTEAGSWRRCLPRRSRDSKAFPMSASISTTADRRSRYSSTARRPMPWG